MGKLCRNDGHNAGLRVRLIKEPLCEHGCVSDHAHEHTCRLNGGKWDKINYGGEKERELDE